MPSLEVQFLGAANDTSNFLSVARLANNNSGSVVSSSSLGTVTANTPLASGRLNASLVGPAIDGAGAGTFTVNGVAIAYNINTDSLTSIINRIRSTP
mgnify:CR=1 FL=1